MSLPEISADVAASVKRLFRSEKRKAIALELLYFDYWPPTDEKQKIADRYELHITSIDKILYRLRDSDLFTKEQGSIPLYRILSMLVICISYLSAIFCFSSVGGQ